MKKALMTLSIASLLSMNAFAADKLIKTCETSLPDLDGTGQSAPMKIEIFQKKDSKYYALVTQTVAGFKGSFKEEAEVSEHEVCEGLTGGDDLGSEDLNLAEQLVSHAMALEYDPIMEGRMSTGIDLKKVRRAKVFDFSKEGDMGKMAIVEAKDKNGKTLGSYLGGFLISSCK